MDNTKINLDFNNFDVIERLIKMKQDTPEEYKKYMKTLKEIYSDFGEMFVEWVKEMQTLTDSIDYEKPSKRKKKKDV